MKSVLALIVVALVVIAVRKLVRYRTLAPLLPRRSNFGKRRDTLREVLRLLEERGATTLMETGEARRGLEWCKGDGASTIVFGTWAKQNHARLDSVDVDPEAIHRADAAVQALDLSDPVPPVTSGSVAYLPSFTEPVDCRDLDSYDRHETDTATQAASRSHPLEEIQAIEARLHEGTVTLIDDCDLPNGGRWKLVIERLTQAGWRVHASDSQVILLQGAEPARPGTA